MYLGVYPSPALSVVVSGALTLALAAVAGAGLRPALEPRSASDVSFWAVAVALSALVIARLGLAYAGWERVGGVAVSLIYWPTVIVLLGCVVAHSVDSAAGDHFRRASARRHASWVVPALAVCAVGAQGLVLFGDTGAALVLFPPLFTAAWWSRAVSPGKLRVGALLGVSAIAGGLAYGVFADASYPPVGAHELWRPRKQANSLRSPICPAPDRENEDTPLDLSDFGDIFQRRNVRVRLDEIFVANAANRLGTRVGAEVHESIRIRNRYAAGLEPTLLGTGFLSATVRRFGNAEVRALLADGAPSVLLAAEGGTASVLGLALLQLAALLAVVRTVDARTHVSSAPPCGAVFVAVACTALPTWATLLMLGGNFGVLPFTGQNTPMLSVQSGFDLLLAPVLWCIALAALRPRP
jgi:hypothetical protein